MTNASTKRKESIERKIKILRITVALTAASFIIFLITLTSSRWIRVDYQPVQYSRRHNLYIARSTYGIIWECVYGQPKLNTTSGKYKSMIYIIRNLALVQFAIKHEIISVIINSCMSDNQQKRRQVVFNIVLSKILSFYIETKCDYHQNQVQNTSSTAEQTLIGMILFIII